MCMSVLLNCAPQACLLSKEVRMHLILLELEVWMIVSWEPNPGHHKEQQVLLTTEISAALLIYSLGIETNWLTMDKLVKPSPGGNESFLQMGAADF